MIKQIHLTECDSTQDILKEQLSPPNQGTVLVSCEYQRKGRGRGVHLWSSLPGTVCFSLNLAPHPMVSFTALEISLLVLRYFEEKGRKLQLKWPNDLWDESRRKCAGVLVQGSHSTYLAGIGINIYSDDPELGAVYETECALSKENVSREIAEFLLSHRYSGSSELKADWEKHCGHLNQRVRINENGETLEGIFRGLGEHGEALLETDSGVKKIFNGSLRAI